MRRWFALAWLVTGCGAFTAVDTAGDAAAPQDAGAPAPDGAAAPDASALDADVDAGRDCVPMSAFSDAFDDRDNGTLKGAWDNYQAGNAATLSIDPVNAIEGLKSLKLDFAMSTQGRSAHLQHAMPRAACRFEVSFSLRVTAHGNGVNILWFLFDGNTQLVVQLGADHTLGIGEAIGGPPQQYTVTSQLIAGTTYRYTLTVDLVAKTADFVLQNRTTNATISSGRHNLATTHGEPRLFRFGGTGAPPGSPFSYFVDELTLQ